MNYTKPSEFKIEERLSRVVRDAVKATVDERGPLDLDGCRQILKLD